MKKYLLLAAAFILILTGCGKATGGDGVLTIWYWDPYINGKSLEAAADMYTETNPEAEFEMVELSTEDLVTKFTTAALSNDMSSLPDIILLLDDGAPTYLSIYNDLFYPGLGDAIDFNDFPAYQIKPSTLDGVTYGLPMGNTAAGLYCNRQIVEDAGLTTDDFADLTWDEFSELGMQIREKTGHYGYAWDAGDILRTMIHSAGVDYVEDDGTININNNEVIKAALDEMTKMYQEGFVYDSIDWTDYVNSLSNGDAACTVSGSWFIPTIKEIPDGDGNWFIAPAPILDGVDSSVHETASGGSSWYVLNNGDEELATDFLATTFGSSTELYEQLLDEIGLVSTYLPMLDDEAYQKGDEFFGGQKIYSDFLSWSAGVPEYTLGPNTLAAIDGVVTYVRDAIKGDSTVQEALDNMQAQAEQSAV